MCISADLVRQALQELWLVAVMAVVLGTTAAGVAVQVIFAQSQAVEELHSLRGWWLAVEVVVAIPAVQLPLAAPEAIMRELQAVRVV